jgi:hypothetical protein
MPLSAGRVLSREQNTIHCLACGGGNSQAIIIAPTLYKAYNISRLHNIWDCAARAISLSRRLVFIGYSLAPSDTSIIATVKRALNAPDQKREIVVVNPNERACERYRQILGKDCRIYREGFKGVVV